jgi:hypothetical protein
MRWEEEVALLDEEKRRVLAFFRWQADWWTEQARLRPFADRSLEEGLLAYSHRQADIRLQLASHFDGLWAGLRKKKGRGTEAHDGEEPTSSTESDEEPEDSLTEPEVFSDVE